MEWELQQHITVTMKRTPPARPLLWPQHLSRPRQSPRRPDRIQIHNVALDWHRRMMQPANIFFNALQTFQLDRQTSGLPTVPPPTTPSPEPTVRPPDCHHPLRQCSTDMILCAETCAESNGDGEGSSSYGSLVSVHEIKSVKKT